MKNHHVIHAAVVLLIVSMTPVVTLAQTEVHEQWWPEADVFIRTTYTTRVFLLAGATRDQLSGPVDAQYGAHFDFGLPPFLRELFTEYDNETQPFQYLVLRLGVRHLTSLSDESDYSENRGIIELTARETLPENLRLALRIRPELRWVNGVYSTRVRTRLWLERTFYPDPSLTVTPYVTSELFWDSRVSTFNRSRTMIGVNVGVVPWFAPEINIGYQRDWELRDSKTYFMSTIFNFYF
ncbi:MAG: DUF2490 domain-containing protein [Ignavibacteriae bacterium]|nr:MAG: DUF2490 domain-containing protein [Ignavibacteriota bacterium]